MSSKLLYSIQIKAEDLKVRKKTAPAVKTMKNKRAYARKSKHRKDWLDSNVGPILLHHCIY